MTNCKQCSIDFIVRDEDSVFYKKFGFSHPELCPSCRLQERLLFRNERNLFRRKNSVDNKDIISIYHPDSPYKIYPATDWWKDTWSSFDYAQDYNFNKTFFEQFQELRLKVPRIALFNINPDNSDYCQQAYDNRRCYLCFVVKDCEDCFYVTHSNRLKDCIDCSHLQNCELCYECLDSDKLYNCFFSESCQNSNDLYFSSDCIGCHYCIGCHGLRNKSYYIFNKSVGKEEFFKKLASLNFGSFSLLSKLKSQFISNKKSFPMRATLNLNVEDSLGNYLVNSKNAYECYDAFEIHDCSYSTWIFESKDCYDIYGMGTSELVYYSLGVEKLYNSAFCTFVSHSSDIFYSDLCFYSSNLFGCVGVKQSKFCILNKQYSEDNYKILRDKIIENMKKTGEWGKFFPKEISPFSYNSSIAQEYFPLSEAQVKERKYAWTTPDQREYQKASFELKDHVKEAGAETLKGTCACTACGKNYKIMPKELKYYIDSNIAITRLCTDCRYKERLTRRSPRKLISRNCDKCNKEISSPIIKERIEKVMCETCYQTVTD